MTMVQLILETLFLHFLPATTKTNHKSFMQQLPKSEPPPTRTASRLKNRQKLHKKCILLNEAEHLQTRQMSKFESMLPCTFTAQYLHADINTWYKT
jgi:hypothetical protein